MLGRRPLATGEKASIRVLFAGSLIIPFAQLEEEFEAAYPDIDVNMEGHGSIQVIRHVSDLHEQADVLVTADYSLIPMLLYQVEDPDTHVPYADWYTIFASNEMTLAYTAESAFAGEIGAVNWPDVITRPDVRVGCADPRLDANGYRALMMVELAEDFYPVPGLFQDVFGGKFRVPIRVTTAAGETVVKVPEVLETKSGSHVSSCGPTACSCCPCSSPATSTIPSSTRAWLGSTGWNTWTSPRRST